MRCFDSDTRQFVNYQVTDNYAYTDTSGVSHRLVGASYVPGIEDCNSQDGSDRDITGTTLDGSGMTVDPASNIVTFKNGAWVAPPVNVPSGSGTYTDTNGNQLTVSGSSFIDTMGMTALSVAGTAPSNMVFTYNDTTGTPRTVTVSYLSQTVQTAFGCSAVGDYGPTSGQYLVDKITFADGTYYQFGYEPTPGAPSNITGRVASVRLPTGGTVSYTYSGANNGINCSDGTALVIARTTSDGTRTYTRSAVTAGSSTTDVQSGTGNHTVYDFVASNTNQWFQTHRWVYTGAATGTPLEEDKTCYDGITSSCDTSSPGYPFSEINIASTMNGTVTKAMDYLYDSSQQMYQSTVYDYASGASPGSAILYNYLGYYGTSGVVGTVSTTDGAGHTVSEVRYNYDENTPTATSGLPNHTSAPGSQRFNLTSVAWGVGSETSKKYNTYDDAGMLLTTRQDTTNVTTFTYDSATDSLLTRVDYPSTTAGGSTIPHQIVVPSPEPNTGLITGVQDQNGNSTTYTYDSMLRLIETDYPDGGKVKSVYTTTGTTPNVQSQVLHSGSSYVTSTAYYDGYGRTTQVDRQDSPADSFINYGYNQDGRLYKVSNPFRSGTPLYTVYAFDGLGRKITTTDTDGSIRYSTPNGATRTVQDEAGKQRELIYDGAGRLIEVLEPDASNSLSLETDYSYYQNITNTSSPPVIPTSYQTVVTQKGGGASTSWRTRAFQYDLVGRLISVNEPESGVTSYSYLSGTSPCSGSPSNPCSRTDANSSTTTYSYDALNRLTGKTYSGSTYATNTPSVTYYYDQSSYNGISISNPIGQQTGMSDGSGTTAWSFDSMGRPTLTSKTINGVNLTSSTSYYPDGNVNVLTDFSGTPFMYGYDSAANVSSVYDNAGNTYASSITHNAAGQLTGMTNQLTAASALYSRTYQYTPDRMLPQEITVTDGGTPIQDLVFSYPVSPNNNGDISKITNAMDATHGRDQQFVYDNLNRLFQAYDGAHWGQQYTYDNWGNLYQTSQITGLAGQSWTASAPGTNNQLSTQGYDAVGQVTSDEHGNSYSYDAEGRILTGGSGTYLYDGSGYRVSKNVSGAVTLYWPSPVAGVTDESNSTGTTFGRQVYVAGVRVWSEPVGGSGVFLFQDHLGSVRIAGTPGGVVKDDIDYLPYGYQFANYGTASANHYKFTDDESDSETTTNYAMFRSLNSNMGRFNRPDPYLGSYNFTHPQSLNRYSYVLGRPMRFIDRIGMDCGYNQATHEDDPDDPHALANSNDGEDCVGGGDSGYDGGYGDGGYSDGGDGGISPDGVTPDGMAIFTMTVPVGTVGSDTTIEVDDNDDDFYGVDIVTFVAPGYGGGGGQNKPAPNNGWDWDEKPHWPTPPTTRQQPFTDCFNGAMKQSAPPGKNTVTVVTTLTSLWNLISPNPVAKTVGATNALFNLGRITSAALVCSDGSAYFPPS